MPAGRTTRSPPSRATTGRFAWRRLAVDIPALQQCATTPVRVTSDSAVKAVGVADNRRFVYAGSSDLLDLTPPSEALLSLIGVVLDQVP